MARSNSATPLSGWCGEEQSNVDLSIVIPCYNEIETIHKLKAELLPVIARMALPTVAGNPSPALARALPASAVQPICTVPPTIEVIFIDDGSQDGTFSALLAAFGDESLPGVHFRFTQHRQNQGLGAALRTGFDLAQGTIIVTTDCDGTYRFQEIPQLVARLTPEVDLVTASPYHPDGAVDGVPPYRLLLSRGSSAIYRMLADRRVYTYTALFRAYRREVIQNVPFQATGFLAGTELLVNAIRMGYRVTEYPTVLHARAFGISKAKIMRTVQAHLGFQMNTLLPWHPYGCVVRGADDTVYLVDDGCKRAFPTAEIFLSHGYHWQQVVKLAQAELDALPSGPALLFRDGTLLRGSGDTTYVVADGLKRPFLAAVDFEALGYRWANVVQIADEQLDLLATGLPMRASEPYPNGTLLRGSDTTVYWLIQGKRAAFPSIQVFQSWGFQWEQVIPVADEELVRYPLTAPVVAQKSMFQHWRTLQNFTYSFAEQPQAAQIAA
jgi:dolichol-phosphate mannosyltransferase